MSKVTTCTKCAAPLERHLIERAPGHAAGWHVSLLRFPVLACPQSHERREAYADFNVTWSEELALGAPIWARKKLLGRLSCPACGGALAPGQGSRSIDLCAGTEFSFVATIEGPWQRCVACEGFCLRPGVDVLEAFADALRAAEVERF